MRTIKPLFFTLLASLVVFISTAQITLTGTIQDNLTNELLIGANVVVKGTLIGTSTDFDGKFEFEYNGDFPVVLEVSFIGYNRKEFTLNSATDKIKFKIASKAIDFKGVEIVDSRLTKKQQEAPLTVEAMDVLAIRETPAASFYDGLGSLKGVDLTAASIGFKIINTRGFNSTSPVRSLQIIDGVDNQSPGLNFSLGNFLGASELDVSGVEIIVGASSAFYGPNAFNGVVSMKTKDPFTFSGLSVMSKVGERGLFETAVRYAEVVQNKEGKDKFGYKLNVSYMQANDWEADNYDPVDDTQGRIDNPGGYDAVNIYGDEFSFDRTNNSGKVNEPGLGRYYRTGYREIDVVDYNTDNLKLSGTGYYKLKDDVQLIFGSSYGTGTTVYQGDNRISIRGIDFFNHKIELKKTNKYFLRTYLTHEDAGDSYDAVFTAFRLQSFPFEDYQDSNNDWSTQNITNNYFNFWKEEIMPSQGNLNLPGWQVFQFGQDFDAWLNYSDSILSLPYALDSLMKWHAQARSHADVNRLVPGTQTFQDEFDRITSTINGNTEFGDQGGTRFFDRSALYHIHGEYKLDTTEIGFLNSLTIGGNYRQYIPVSRGTIFADTLDPQTGNYREIRNREFGFYVGGEKRAINDLLKLNATVRLDKNQNFDFLVSPALSAVYTASEKTTLRLSLSSAIRNPTLLDQYYYYNVGPAILRGNTDGINDVLDVDELLDYQSLLPANRNRNNLNFYNIDPIAPEKVKTVEGGIRTTLFEKLYVDASYYISNYRDFIGYQIVASDVAFQPAGLDTNAINGLQIYRVASNSTNNVITQGFSIGLNYYFGKFYELNGNYSWNKLTKTDENDPIIPAFNTPEHKFNIGISARDIMTEKIKNVGFSVNYKWIEGFVFEGSPQFTGFIPSYDLLDAQINKYVPKIKTTFKLGASNALNKKQFQVYGGPRIGRMAYFSVLLDLNRK